MDQMARDSDCRVDRCSSIVDHRFGGIYLALGSVNRFTRRFAAIRSTFKSDAGAIPDSDSHRPACTQGDTDSYTNPDTVTKSSACASASPT